MSVHILKDFVVLALLVVPWIGTAMAQSYPTKPIRWIVTYPPGGTTDVVARNVAQAVGQELGVAIVVENKAGAGGVIGMDATAKSDPDGYTFLVSDASLATAPSLYKSIPFDPIKDLAAVSLFVTVPHVIVVNPSVPATTIGELVALSKKDPRKLNFSSGGNGSPLHLAGEVFRSATGVTWTHIPYKGAGPAILAIMTGEAQVAAPSVPAALGHISGGKMRAIALMAEKRLEKLPDVPTVVELGYKNAVMTGWIGLHAPAGTPAPIGERLQVAVSRALATPALRSRLQDLGANVVAGSAQDYSKMVSEEIVRWRGVVSASGITPQ